MLTSIITFFADYLKQKPFTDVLMIVLIGVFIWNEQGHSDRTNTAHSTMREVMKERDDANERNTDRIISALTGVKREVQKLPAAAAKAAKAIDEAPAADVDDESGPGI